ncbi:MAG: MFS transporter [Actinobacteria bacterium]|nr:MFS transporter [Actinomycetota bacterium]
MTEEAGNSGGSTPDQAPLVLLTLILVATVANLNLSVANVALPDIGLAFDASQLQINLVAVGYSLGLASSVLYLGAIGDRYGRKTLLLLGTGLAIPASLLAAWAPSVGFLIAFRILGGFAAGMAFPTTLALITALWSGQARTRSIALWSAIGGAMAALGPLVSGLLLQWFWWGSPFLFTVPLAAVAVVLALKLIPAHVGESDEQVDHFGGVVSVVFVAALVAAITFVVKPEASTLALVLFVVAVVAGVVFILQQRRAPNPLYDLHYAARPTFWVAAIAGIIVFGSLMGGIFIAQQYLQNVEGYSPLASGASVLPAALVMVVVAPRSAKLIESIGSRATLLVGYVLCFAGLLVMLFVWGDGTSYVWIAVAVMLVGAGVGLAGTPASRSLTGSVPVQRVGMASGTADLQRDLGAAIMQSIMGALLTAGYAGTVADLIAGAPTEAQQQLAGNATTTLQKSFSSAANVAERYPQYADAIIAGARESFVAGQDWAFSAAAIAVALGAVLVWFCFPNRDRELELIARYAAEDGSPSATI